MALNCAATCWSARMASVVAMLSTICGTLAQITTTAMTMAIGTGTISRHVRLSWRVIHPGRWSEEGVAFAMAELRGGRFVARAVRALTKLGKGIVNLRAGGRDFAGLLKFLSGCRQPGPPRL